MQLNSVAGGAGRLTGNATQPEPRLVRAAREFEAQLMKELLEPMARKSTLFADKGEEEGQSGVLSEYAAESLARGLSEQGGLGIAKGVIRELSRSGHTAGGGKSNQP